jgi:hypothetical protein
MCYKPHGFTNAINELIAISYTEIISPKIDKIHSSI